jgi:hypothetical protein
MVKIFEDYKSEIEKYCAENNLSAEKVFSSACSYSNERVCLQHVDPVRGVLGLADNIPAPRTLLIFLENGKLRFVQTDITHKYLGIDEPTHLRLHVHAHAYDREYTKEAAFA